MLSPFPLNTVVVPWSWVSSVDDLLPNMHTLVTLYLMYLLLWWPFTQYISYLTLMIVYPMSPTWWPNTMTSLFTQYGHYFDDPLPYSSCFWRPLPNMSLTLMTLYLLLPLNLACSWTFLWLPRAWDCQQHPGFVWHLWCLSYCGHWRRCYVWPWGAWNSHLDSWWQHSWCSLLPGMTGQGSWGKIFVASPKLGTHVPVWGINYLFS